MLTWWQPIIASSVVALDLGTCFSFLSENFADQAAVPHVFIVVTVCIALVLTVRHRSQLSLPAALRGLEVAHLVVQAWSLSRTLFVQLGSASVTIVIHCWNSSK